MDLQAYLSDLDSRYSPQERMVASVISSPGYHTRVEPGRIVHSTRTAGDYVLALLESGEPPRVSRAHEVLDRLLSLQRVDPTSRFYGIWSWYLEEPLEQMNPADWNWADFIGARLAQVLAEHEPKLSVELAQRTRDALGHAAWSIFRRNVQSSYTNIAIMGAGVTLAAGEILGERRLVDYGRKRLHDMVESVAINGDFREYNSPTYTKVALEELERILQLVKDPVAREDAEHLRRVAWRVIAEHFHPATQQWAGPHSRAYHDHIEAALARYLSKATGVPIRAHSEPVGKGRATDHSYSPVRPIPCPADLVERFRRLPESPHQIERVFIPLEPPQVSVRGTTWFDEAACLGSINRDMLWTQRRALIGYWRTDADPAVVLRLRCLKNGRDFAPAHVVQAQAGPRVLTAFHFATGGGDFHPLWETPPDSVYPDVTDLRLRYSLEGVGVEVAELGPGRFELSAGGQRAVVHVAASQFEDRPIQWEVGRENNRVFVDAVLHSGGGRSVDLRSAELLAASAVELIGRDVSASEAPVTVRQVSDDRYEAAWLEGLRVQAPVRGVSKQELG